MSNVAACLLDSGPLLPVARVAELVLGEPVAPRTILRWSLGGRRGVPLPTRRGRRRKHVTTESAFRWWIAATSGAAPASPLTEADAATLSRWGVAS